MLKRISFEVEKMKISILEKGKFSFLEAKSSVILISKEFHKASASKE
jgi:hypothetical protein